MSNVFTTASESRFIANNTTLINAEVRAIEAKILEAVDNNYLTVDVVDTPYMTSSSSPIPETFEIFGDGFYHGEHGLKTGDKIRFTTSDQLPEPLQINTDYYVFVDDPSNFRIAASLEDLKEGNYIEDLDPYFQIIGNKSFANQNVNMINLPNSTIEDGDSFEINGILVEINEVEGVISPSMIINAINSTEGVELMSIEAEFTENGRISITNYTNSPIELENNNGTPLFDMGFNEGEYTDSDRYILIPSSNEYFRVWQKTSTDRLLESQMNIVISYFENQGYSIVRLTQSNNQSFFWRITW